MGFGLEWEWDWTVCGSGSEGCMIYDDAEVGIGGEDAMWCGYDERIGEMGAKIRRTWFLSCNIEFWSEASILSHVEIGSRGW